MTKTYKLIAYSGDLSATGMGSEATIVSVAEEHLDIVNKYMELHDELDYISVKYGYDQKKCQNAFRELLIAVKKLHEFGIFRNKYYNRSSWAWMETPSLN